MIFLNDDGTLDIDRINQLPMEEWMEAIGDMTQEQYNYYLSVTPKADCPSIVDIFGEDENGRIYSDIDFHCYNQKKKEIYENFQASIPCGLPDDKMTRLVQQAIDAWIPFNLHAFIPNLEYKILSILSRWTGCDTPNYLYTYHLCYVILDVNGEIVSSIQDFEVKPIQSNDTISFQLKFRFKNLQGEMIVRELMFEESIESIENSTIDSIENSIGNQRPTRRLPENPHGDDSDSGL